MLLEKSICCSKTRMPQYTEPGEQLEVPRRQRLPGRRSHMTRKEFPCSGP